MENTLCSVCGGLSKPLDVVDFNKSCEESREIYLELSGIPIYYYLCDQCGFCFAPEIYKWSLDEFSKKIYNEEYINIDPDYKKIRPESNANGLREQFKGKEHNIKHLDYGGGNGILSELLKEYGWNSYSYDPFVNHDIKPTKLGQFNLITAYEVFEHVPDVNQLMSQLTSLLTEDGIILFSTFLSDGHIQQKQRLNWWYASPRNGHISIFSGNSLNILAKKYNVNVRSFSANFHLFFKSVPDWAAHMFNKG